jgi:voltage-dependent potassium channel beta subunit
MEYRNLGNSGLQVSVLSFGSWITFGNQINNRTAEELMRLAFEKGVNFFDNAEAYAQGKSEIVMGNILKKLGWDRSSYLVSSKVFFGDGGKLPNQTGLSRKHIFEACHASLRRLQVEYLDLYFCHRPDKKTPIEETVWAMNHLIQQGKIFYWGTSQWSAQEITHANMVAQRDHLIGPTMEQPQYNMFHRHRMEVEYDQIFKTVGLGTTIWSPLASGTLTNKYINKLPGNTRMSIENMQWLKDRSLTQERLEKVAKLDQIAKDLDTSLAKMAIAWCVKNPNVSTVILGASKTGQLAETLGSLDVVPMLTSDVEDAIESILENKPKKPTF